MLGLLISHSLIDRTLSYVNGDMDEKENNVLHENIIFKGNHQTITNGPYECHVCHQTFDQYQL